MPNNIHGNSGFKPNNRTLRQRTWEVKTKPFTTFGTDYYTHHGDVSFIHPCQTGGSCPSYVSVNGEAWITFKTTTSFAEVREAVKELMDQFGISRFDIQVTELIPIDHIITPLA